MARPIRKVVCSMTYRVTNDKMAPLQSGAGVPITVKLDGKTRTAGFAMPNGYWYRRMDRSRNFWRTGGEAIAAGRAALTEAQRLGCTACKVLDAESGDTYLCSINDYERYGRSIHRPGWEPQIALNLKYWHVVKRDGTEIQSASEEQTKELPAVSPVQPKPEAEQLDLFGGGAL